MKGRISRTKKVRRGLRLILTDMKRYVYGQGRIYENNDAELIDRAVAWIEQMAQEKDEKKKEEANDAEGNRPGDAGKGDVAPEHGAVAAL